MDLWGDSKPIIGVVHLLPLPGAPGYQGSLERITERALSDAKAYLEGGLSGVLVENFGDIPFFAGQVPPETVAAMTAIALRIRDLGDFPLGINVLRCDALAALAVGEAVGAQFIRINLLSGTMVTDQGIIEGDAANLIRKRAAIKSGLDVWADLLVKHASPLTPVDPVEVALDLVERASADSLILTGPRTGAPLDLGQLEAIRRAVPKRALIAGSGVNGENLGEIFDQIDGFLVGTALKERSRTSSAVDPQRVKKLVTIHQTLLRAGS